MKAFLTHLLTAAAAAGLVYFFTHRTSDVPQAGAGERKPLFFQSPMHPWVKSDKPGTCTVCGMNLVPVYEGGGDASSQADASLVMLPPGSPNVIGVQTELVSKRKLTRTLRLAGMIDDDDTRHRILSAYSPGRIEKLFVNFDGAEVVAGQPMALFYSKELLAAASDYKIAARTGSGAMNGAALRLRQLGLTQEQIAKVPERKDDDIYFELAAPMSGTVVKRNVYEGQWVEEGASLFEIGDFSTMWCQLIAYEQDLPWLKEGQEVKISTPILPGKTLTGTVKFINPNLDDMTRSARVRVEVENKDRALRHKAYADATVEISAGEGLALPKLAVIWPGAQPRVYIEKDAGVYEQRQVKLGISGDSWHEALDGVSEGERVVTNGAMMIDGQAQLNHLGTTSGPVPAIDASDDALAGYFRGAAAVSEALASDDLDAANAALKQLPTAPAGLVKAGAPAPGKDLKEIRKAFLPWSQELAAAAAAHKNKLPNVMVFRCPMTDDLWEGAPKNARWIQLSANTRNPYFGKEMLDCGAPVK